MMSSIWRRLVLRNHYRRLVHVGRMPYAVANCPPIAPKTAKANPASSLPSFLLIATKGEIAAAASDQGGEE